MALPSVKGPVGSVKVLVSGTDLSSTKLRTSVKVRSVGTPVPEISAFVIVIVTS